MMAQRLFQTLAILAGLAVVAALPIPALAQDGPDYPEYSGSYALLIGMSEYDYYNSWRNLPNVPGYLERMEKALELVGFDEVKVIESPDRTALSNALDAFVRAYGEKWSNHDNRLLIYFIGHGYRELLDERNDEYKGYLVSKDDAPVSSPDSKLEFLKEAVPMEKLWELAKSIKAKHTLFILDSCFSGLAITAGRETILLSSPPDQNDRKNWGKPVTQIITSGNERRRVPAQSIFTELFLEAVTTARGDDDGDGFVTGTELGEFLNRVIDEVSQNYQTPYYVKLFGGEGDFVFRVPRDNP